MDLNNNTLHTICVDVLCTSKKTSQTIIT